MEDLEPEPAPTTLRMRAEAWLNGRTPMPDVRLWETGIEALASLYKIAHLPASSGEALKLLHELQVHQVELALQREELEKAYSDLSAANKNERDRYGFVPVGYLTICRDLKILDINRTAARWFGSDVPSLITRSFDALITPESKSLLITLLAGLPRIGLIGGSPIQVVCIHRNRRRLQLIAKVSATGQEYCVAVIDATDWISPNHHT